MRRSIGFLSFAFLFAATAAIAESQLPKANTRDALKAYVEAAAKLVQKEGAASCATLATKDWRDNDYYIFVSGPDGKVLCHPNEKIVGTLEADVTNSKGEKVGQKVAKMAMNGGMGWVEYLWLRPATKKEEIKINYVMGVTGPDGKHYTVGAGGWDLK